MHDPWAHSLAMLVGRFPSTPTRWPASMRHVVRAQDEDQDEQSHPTVDDRVLEAISRGVTGGSALAMRCGVSVNAVYVAMSRLRKRGLLAAS